MLFVRSQFLAALALALSINVANGQSEGAGHPEIIPHKINPHEADASPTAGSTGQITPSIVYNGGQVLATPTVYLIWYGNWAQNNGMDTAEGQTIIRDFLKSVSQSPYYMINKTYGTPTGSVNVGREYSDPGSQGTKLTDANIQTIVTNAIASGKLGPADLTGVYFVLTSSNVSEKSGFCTKYCGWHTAGLINKSNIKYAFVGNGGRCLNACAAQTVGPNGNAGVDAMMSVIAHELEEANTDPTPDSGWTDSKGAENADKCAWTFGQHLSVAPNGAYYNVTLPPGGGPGSRNYLIQRNLDVNSRCYIDYVSGAQ